MSDIAALAQVCAVCSLLRDAAGHFECYGDLTPIIERVSCGARNALVSKPGLLGPKTAQF